MNSRERVFKALRFERPDRAPRDLWTVPGIAMFHPEDLKAVVERYPNDIVLIDDAWGASVGGYGSLKEAGEALCFRYGRSGRAHGTPYLVGTYTDDWGVPFTCGEDGIVGEVKQPPITDWKLLEHFKPPWETLTGANWDDVNRIHDASDKFLLTPWHVDPFERMQFLRGTQRIYTDLGEGSKEVLLLRDMVHEFCLKEIELWCKTDIDGIRFSDDWGSQRGPLISPKMWREIFKPMYAGYAALARAAGKPVFYHTDGHVAALVADFIEIGVNAMNMQLFCMDIEDLARRFKGKLTFWGELDRQKSLSFGTPEDVYRDVRRVRKALDDGQGGVIAQFEWYKNVPRANVEAAFEAWLEPM